ncbi:MAG TPA: ABC transporter substrate-binding protein [Pseudolabrys sp.]|jgi:putative ABC transport system substrate-binding protein|nr:ABC transporter substrate-binding protein [Pseudolabrys sp.]
MRRRDFITFVGGAVATPLVARAQQAGKVHQIAVVHPSHPISDLRETGSIIFFRALFTELRRLGYVEDKNMIIARYSAEGRNERHAEIVRDVVKSRPDLIFTVTPEFVRLFKAATTAIPIVALTQDPIAFGLVASIARPGGNITGVTVDAGLEELWSKRLQILKELAPKVSKVALLCTQARWAVYEQEIPRLAQKIGVSIFGATVGVPVQATEFRRAFAEISQGKADGLLVDGSAENLTNRRLIIELCEQASLPAIYPYREYAEIGGLMVYAVDLVSQGRRAAAQVDEILKGANPGEIPFSLVTKYDFIINLKTAKALGLTVPPHLTVAADEVIE